MIVVKLQGGLGNQMFQYAIGKRLALQYGTPLKLDRTFLTATVGGNDPGITPRKYELDQLSVTTPAATPDDVRLFSNSGNLLHRVQKYLTQSKYITEKSFRFDPAFLKYGKHCYLDGFWQCEQYFTAISDQLRNDFKCCSVPDEKNAAMKARIGAVNAVSIHIRRGDYIHNPAAQQFHGSCSTDYYMQAVELLSARLNDPHFFIFSDDVNWVTANFSTLQSSTIVNINGSNSGVKDLQLMSACKHHIIANSSFSWWGAWLGNCRDKIVVGPKKWFADTTVDTSTVLPESWYKL